jgi:hypothetical protein
MSLFHRPAGPQKERRSGSRSGFPLRSTSFSSRSLVRARASVFESLYFASALRRLAAARSCDCRALRCFDFRSMLRAGKCGIGLPRSSRDRSSRGHLTIGSSDRGCCVSGEPRRGVDDQDKAASFGADATPRRSTSSLGDLIALTGRVWSETMLAWNSMSSGT